VAWRGARARAGGSSRQRHIGYHLIDKGRPALEASVGARIEWRRRARRWVDRWAAPLFIGGILGGAALVELALALALMAAGDVPDSLPSPSSSSSSRL
jgi:hypothetical protein